MERLDPVHVAAVELGGARTALGVPMLKENQLIGAFALIRQEVRPFTEKQIALVENFAAQAVIAIENARLLGELRERTDEVVKLNQQLERRVADQVSEIERMGRLRRFLPPQVADLIVASGTEKQLESHRREITALFCDLRGFTGFSESADPEDVMALLREYHAAIGDTQFEKRHPIGTRPRLAFGLLLYTGQRRSDVVRMGRQHIDKNGAIRMRQLKTGAELAIPVHAELDAIIAETPGDHLTFLTTQFGKPFTAAGFGNWFREQCNLSGLPHCSAHGLRKAAARRLAEAGCTEHEIAAITGHASLREITRYTKAADQVRLAVSAMDKVRTSTVKPGLRFDKKGKNT